MSLAGIKNLFWARFKPPAPTTSLFTGKSILITGVSSGIAFEAAKKLINLEVDTLVITARNQAKTQEVFHSLDDYGKSLRQKTKTKIIPMVLSMDSTSDVKNFVDELKRKEIKLDAAVLSAAVNQREYQKSVDGFEFSLQVNAISTLLLGIHLLPVLLKNSNALNQRNGSDLPHLVFVSSGNVWRLKEEQFKIMGDSPSPLKTISEPGNFPEGKFGGVTVYSRSKVILEFGMRHLAALPSLQFSPGSPKIMIQTVCPGMVNTGLGRQFRGRGNFIVDLLLSILLFIVCRTIPQGANSYISALTRGPEYHGQMWKNDIVYKPEGAILLTEKGRRVGEHVWADTLKTLQELDPEVREILSTQSGS